MPEQHPCTRFQRGEVHTFPDAMATLIAQQEYERDELRKYPGVTQQDRMDAQAAVFTIKNTTLIATDIYARIVVPAFKAAATEMRQHLAEYPHLAEIADALEDQDYSGLSL
jgi:hypothetical protein